MGSPCSPVVANLYMEYFEERALAPEAPIQFKYWSRYVDDVLSTIHKGKSQQALDYLNSIDSHIKFTIERPDEQGAVPFLDTHPRPDEHGKLQCKVYRKPTHTDKYLDWRSNHPTSAKRAVVRALTDRANNVCSSPEELGKELDHLHKVLKYNHYPDWIIKSGGRPRGPLLPRLDPKSGLPITKQRYVSVPYFPGLSESFKTIFRDTPVEICFKGKNTLKSMLMHPKDPIPKDTKKDVIYKWTCTAPGCNTSYIGETGRTIAERAKEHGKASTNCAIYEHCNRFDHPLPTVEQFALLGQEPSQVTREAKEAIFIRQLDPSLNRNVGKMVIPKVFNDLLKVKPKNRRVASLRSSSGSQTRNGASVVEDPDLNICLTQFHNTIPNFKGKLRCSNRADRAINRSSN